MLAIGMTGDSCRHALAAADKHEEIYVSVGRHPHESEGFDDAGARGAARAVRTSRRRARSARRASTTSATTRRATTSAARSSRRSSWRRRSRGRSSCTRARPRTTRSSCSTRHGEGVAGDHPLLLAVRPRAGVRRARAGTARSRATSPIRRRPTCSAPRAEVPDELLLAETDAPFLSPQERRSKPNEPAYVTATARYLARAARHLCRGDGAPPGRQRRPPLRLVSEVRASLDRMSRHGIQPNRELGQNFLVDDNVLEVIGRTAELDPRRRRARDRRRPRRAERIPRAARPPPARGRDRRAARARAARGARRTAATRRSTSAT